MRSRRSAAGPGAGRWPCPATARPVSHRPPARPWPRWSRQRPRVLSKGVSTYVQVEWRGGCGVVEPGLVGVRGGGAGGRRGGGGGRGGGGLGGGRGCGERPQH